MSMKLNTPVGVSLVSTETSRPANHVSSITAMQSHTDGQGLDHFDFHVLRCLLENPVIGAVDLAELLQMPRRTLSRRLGKLTDRGCVTWLTPACVGVGNERLFYLTQLGRAVCAGKQTHGITQRAERCEQIARQSGAHPLGLLRIIGRLPHIVGVQRVCTQLLQTLGMLALVVTEDGNAPLVQCSWIRQPRYSWRVPWRDYPMTLTLDGILLVRQSGRLAPGVSHHALFVWYDDGEIEQEAWLKRFRAVLLYCRDHRMISLLFPQVVVATNSNARVALIHEAAVRACQEMEEHPLAGVILVERCSPSLSWGLTTEMCPLTPSSPITFDASLADDELVSDLATDAFCDLATVWSTAVEEETWRRLQQPSQTALELSIGVSACCTWPIVPASEIVNADSSGLEERRDSGNAESEAIHIPFMPPCSRVSRATLMQNQRWADQLPTALHEWAHQGHKILKVRAWRMSALEGRGAADSGLSATRENETRNEQVEVDAENDPIASADDSEPWEQFTSIQRSAFQAAVMFSLHRRHLVTLALIGMHPLVSVEDIAWCLNWQASAVLRIVRDLRAFGLCDELLLPAPRSGLPALMQPGMDVKPLVTCLRLRKGGRALLHRLYGYAPQEIRTAETCFRLRDVRIPTTHDTGIHRFGMLLRLLEVHQEGLSQPGRCVSPDRRTKGHFLEEWHTSVEQCALSYSMIGESQHEEVRHVVPDARGVWTWLDRQKGDERSREFWLEWDTGTEGEPKLRHKLAAYLSYARQFRERHWSVSNFTYPLLLFVVPTDEREVWLARIVTEVAASRVRQELKSGASQQDEEQKNAESALMRRVQPARTLSEEHRLPVYVTTLARLGRDPAGPLGAIWLQLAPEVPVLLSIVRTPMDATSTVTSSTHVIKQRKGEKPGKRGSYQQNELAHRPRWRRFLAMFQGQASEIASAAQEKQSALKSGASYREIPRSSPLECD